MSAPNVMRIQPVIIEICHSNVNIMVHPVDIENFDLPATGFLAAAVGWLVSASSSRRCHWQRIERGKKVDWLDSDVFCCTAGILFCVSLARVAACRRLHRSPCSFDAS